MVLFFNELIQFRFIQYIRKIWSFLIEKWAYFRTKFYGAAASVEIIVEYLYVIVSFNHIFMFNSAYIFFWYYGCNLVQDFCHSPSCARYKSATLKMYEFGHMWRSWQCSPNFAFFTKTRSQIRNLYRFCF